MKLYNFILTIAAALVLILVLTDITLARKNAGISQTLNQVQQLLSSVPNNRNAFSTIATRVNQSGVQDGALKSILQKLEISIAPQANEPTR